jgi:hypothetical protein
MSSIATFKSSVEKCRNILRTNAITGMDSMRHITLYLLSRYITLDRCTTLNIPPKFAWEAIMDTLQKEDNGIQLALDRFYHPRGNDCLVNYFDSLFGTTKFSFDMKDPAKHAEILEILNTIRLNDLDMKTDVLGWVYEQHLGTGSAHSRDLGQFYTDRPLCHYMVELAQPKFKQPGVPESVWDPSMGTGGLISAYIHAFDGKNVKWNVQQKQINGCDNDEKVAGIARANLFIETGTRMGNLLTYDSLVDANNKLQTGYDVIIGNMPFGVTGLKFTDCCERIRNMKIPGTKSEPLFLQLMMASLNPNGRCVVVVPDGILNNKQSNHPATRKYLLDNFNLKKVIKTNSEFFTNSTIQPSILVFENSGPTTEIEFYSVEKMNDSVKETFIQKVSRDMLNDIHVLDVRFCKTSPTLNVPASRYPIVKFGDMFVKAPPKSVNAFNSKDMDNKGSVPFFNGCWDSPKGNHSNASYSNPEPYFVAIKGGGGDHSSDKLGLGMMFLIKGDVAITGANFIFIKRQDCTFEFDPEYIHSYMRQTIRSLRDLAKKTTNLEHLSIDAFTGFEVALPPLDVQKKLIAQRREYQIEIDKRVAEIAELELKQKELFKIDV